MPGTSYAWSSSLECGPPLRRPTRRLRSSRIVGIRRPSAIAKNGSCSGPPGGSPYSVPGPIHGPSDGQGWFRPLLPVLAVLRSLLPVLAVLRSLR